MTGKYHFVRQTKGVAIHTEDGYAVLTMSWMDAACLLWDLKDFLRRSKIGRDCVDDVHRGRLRVR